MSIILLLVQDKTNESVRMLVDALAKKMQEKNEDHQVVIWEINQTQTAQIVGTSLKLLAKKNHDHFFNHSPSIPLHQISLVIKRTWGPIREEVLKICRSLEQHHIPVLNGCEFIEWSHYKIRQYQTLKHSNLFPLTLCYNQTYIDSIKTEDHMMEIDKFVKQANAELRFPLIFKTNKGCRGDGVFYVTTMNALQQLIKSHIENNDYKLHDGFLLQQFIQSSVEEQISNYYRLNIVNDQIQSAMQFQLQWEPATIQGVLKLVDFKNAKDKPVSLATFDSQQLHKIITVCPSNNGVIGVDVLWNCATKRLYLLEYNDGPNISLSVKAGQAMKDSTNEDERIASQQCATFALSIADHCLTLAKLNFRPALTAKL